MAGGPKGHKQVDKLASMGYSKIMKNLTERKRKELIQFIKNVGAPHIYTTYNFYLKEMGCEELIPDGPEDPILDA